MLYNLLVRQDIQCLLDLLQFMACDFLRLPQCMLSMCSSLPVLRTEAKTQSHRLLSVPPLSQFRGHDEEGCFS